MNELHSFELHDIGQHFTIPMDDSFLTGMSNALVYKFQPNITIKMYPVDGNMSYRVELYKKKVPIQKWTKSFSEIYTFIDQELNKKVQDMVNDSCCGEYQDGFNT